MEVIFLNIPLKLSEDTHIQTLRALFRSALIGATLLAASVSHAALDVGRARALPSQNTCLNCHTIEPRAVGPIYEDIAAKYRDGNPAVPGAHVKSGEAGEWGGIVMPSQAQLSNTDARISAAWVLADCPDQ